MSSVEPNKIVVKNVFKIFGNRSKEALALIKQNQSKDQVLAQTGCVVGSTTCRCRSAVARFSSSWACPAPANRRWCATSTG